MEKIWGSHLVLWFPFSFVLPSGCVDHLRWSYWQIWRLSWMQIRFTAQIYCFVGGKKDRKKRGNNKNWKKKTQKARIWFQSHFTSYARVVHSEGSYILVFFYLACGLTEVWWRRHSFACGVRNWHFYRYGSGVFWPSCSLSSAAERGLSGVHFVYE